MAVPSYCHGNTVQTGGEGLEWPVSRARRCTLNDLGVTTLFPCAPRTYIVAFLEKRLLHSRRAPVSRTKFYSCFEKS